jgi:ATP-dependent DNA ligase
MGAFSELRCFGGNRRTKSLESYFAVTLGKQKRGLDGAVSKRRDAPYRSSECRDWRKEKTVGWREANQERWRLFEKTW